MSTKNLVSYINDHLAGSIAALDLLNHLKENPSREEVKNVYTGLYYEIEADQRLLKGLLENLGQKDSALRQTVGWVAEKASRLKLELAGLTKEGLGLLEALELLSLGIEGKRVLWRALANVAFSYPAWTDVNFWGLEQRAMEQRNRIEALRLEVASDALAGG